MGEIARTSACAVAPQRAPSRCIVCLLGAQAARWGALAVLAPLRAAAAAGRAQPGGAQGGAAAAGARADQLAGGRWAPLSPARPDLPSVCPAQPTTALGSAKLPDPLSTLPPVYFLIRQDLYRLGLGKYSCPRNINSGVKAILMATHLCTSVGEAAADPPSRPTNRLAALHAEALRSDPPYHYITPTMHGDEGALGCHEV